MRLTSRDVVIGLALAGIIVLGVGLVFWGRWGYWGRLGGMPMMGFGIGLGLFLLPLFFLALMVAVLGWGFKGTREMPRESRDLEIVRERYARGEITREQYEQMLKDLGYQ